MNITVGNSDISNISESSLLKSWILSCQVATQLDGDCCGSPLLVGAASRANFTILLSRHVSPLSAFLLALNLLFALRLLLTLSFRGKL
jgi:hypothetical protein